MSNDAMKRCTLILSLALAVLLPAGALAAQPEVFHDNFSFSEENGDLCGVTVDVVAEGVFTTRNFFDNEGSFTRFVLTHSEKLTYTAANGKSVILHVAGQDIALPVVVDEAAGTVTTFFTSKGLTTKLQTPNGPVLLRDAGLVTSTATLDLETDELISLEILVVKGPHPALESGFTRFCEVFTDALA